MLHGGDVVGNFGDVVDGHPGDCIRLEQQEVGERGLRGGGTKALEAETSARRTGSQELQERTRAENPHRLRRRLNRGEVGVARDQDVGVAGDRGGEYPSIGRIPNLGRPRPGRFGDSWERREHGIDGLDAIGRDLELAGQDAPQFLQDDVADDQVMFSKYGTEDIGAQAARGEGRY